MADQKLENLLNLAMDATEREREKSLNLNVGFDEAEKTWEIIVKYSGEGKDLEGPNRRVEPLLGGYAVVTLPETELDTFSDLSQVEYVEKPKRLYFSVNEGKRASCFSGVQASIPAERSGNLNLTGRGVLVGIVDSGIDYRHPDFRREDGSTRILKLWDQTQGVYTEEEINRALELPPMEGYALVPERDFSGHGTAVAGIAAGNGRASDGVYRGVAYESDLLVVKLGLPRSDSFPRTTELMRGVDVLIREAVALGRPIAVNLSFGNNYGSHEPYN